MRVFIGTVDISSRIRDITRALHQRGIDTYTAKRTGNAYYVSDVDCVFSKKYTFYFRGIQPPSFQRFLQKSAEKTVGVQAQTVRKVMKECDAAIFIFRSIYNDRSDIRILRDAGKNIITIFVGSDVRSSVAADIEFRDYGINAPFPSESISLFQEKARYVRLAEKYSDAIFSRPDQAQIQNMPYLRNVPFLNVNDFTPEFHRRKNPVVIHASRNDPIKGSEIIAKIIAELQGEGLKFSYVRPQGVPQNEIRKMMRDSDIVIDQLFLPGGGKISMEGLASGCVVLSRMEYGNYTQLYKEKPPIIDVNPENFKSNLRSMIKNHDLRCEISKKGPDYVRRNANIDSMADDIVELLSCGSIKREFDFSPNFLNRYYKNLPEEYQASLQSGI